MALTRCSDCGNEVSTDATACPKCGKPVAVKSSGSSGCLAPILIGLVGLVMINAMMDESSTVPKPASPPVFDQSPAHQAKRKAAIESAIAGGWFGKVTDASGRPEVWVTPGFMALSFDTKKVALAGVYGYYFDGSVPYRRLFLIDNRTGKQVGEFSLKHGLKLEADKP